MHKLHPEGQASRLGSQPIRQDTAGHARGSGKSRRKLMRWPPHWHRDQCASPRLQNTVKLTQSFLGFWHMLKNFRAKNRIKRGICKRQLSSWALDINLTALRVEITIDLLHVSEVRIIGTRTAAHI